MSDRSQRLTKRQQRLADKGVSRVVSPKQFHFDLKPIQPMTENQRATFEAYEAGDNLLLEGCPGTGKSFLSLYLSFRELFSRGSDIKKVIIIRSAQPGKQIGFLPGTEKEKLEVYEAPYKAIVAELFGRDDAYEILKTKGVLEFHSTSFLRGTTIDDACIILDEMQNGTYQEIRTVLTRVGINSRVILCGDVYQDDLTSARYKEVSGISNTMKVLSNMSGVTSIHFTLDDIVRSGFVKQFIIAESRTRLD